MTFKLGRTLDKYDVNYRALAKRIGRSVSAVYTDAYVRGVRSKFNAMAYAYALDCDIKEILEPSTTETKHDWRQPCLPGCDL